MNPIALVLAVVAILAIAGCADDPRPLETPSAGDPCGAAWHPCYDFNADGAPRDTGMCCPNGTACGGHFPNVGPAGYCEPDQSGAVGAAKPIRQRPAH